MMTLKDETNKATEYLHEYLLAIAAGLLERGAENSYYEINDFRRCDKCGWGYFVSATGRAKLIQCPRSGCGHIQGK